MTAPAAPYRAPGMPVGAGYRVAVTPRRRAGWRAWALLAVTVVGAFFVMIWSRIALDHTAFQLQEIESETSEEWSLHKDLELEVARLQAPDRIVEAATEMGMVYPATVRTVEVAGLGGDGSEAEARWVDLKAVLGAQP